MSDRTETPSDGLGREEPETTDGPTIDEREWTFEVKPGERVSTALITAVAELTDQDPLRMERPLYEGVDVDALDALFSGSGSEGVEEVVFTLDSYEVVVHAEGTISIVED
ncbi:HalOD1 output domain-containing protein [Natronorarus salvus]|uniref:HalOD1 output domain-containing protein n=1 Tax=Natronorarus salvus TaxID=3117733 RepID=UPI002F268742